MKYKCCGRITTLVILVSFLTGFPVFGEPSIAPPKNSTESGMRLFSESEVDLRRDDITTAAVEAIEQAAAEAAKAAAIAGIEREGILVQERAAAVREANHWKTEFKTAKGRGVKNMVITGVVCLLGGLAIGIGGGLLLGGR
jgi:hypothetical protein